MCCCDLSAKCRWLSGAEPLRACCSYCNGAMISSSTPVGALALDVQRPASSWVRAELDRKDAITSESVTKFIHHNFNQLLLLISTAVWRCAFHRRHSRRSFLGESWWCHPIGTGIGRWSGRWTRRSQWLTAAQFHAQLHVLIGQTINSQMQIAQFSANTTSIKFFKSAP